MIRSLSVLFLVCVLAGSAFAKNLNVWRFSSEKDLKRAGFFVARGMKANMSFDPSATPGKDYKGSLKVEIFKGNSHPSTITPYFPSDKPVISGVEYKISMFLKTEKAMEFKAHCLLNCPPWTSLQKKNGKLCKTEAGKWKRFDFSFKADFSTNRNQSVRVPVLFLGNFGPGTKVWIAEVIFSGPDNLPEAALKRTEAGIQSPIANFKKLVDWNTARAWKQTDGSRGVLCLNQFWAFSPVDSSSDKMPEKWGCFIVPGHWRSGNLTNYMRLSDGRECGLWNGKAPQDYNHAWYRRTFDLPAGWKSGQVLLDMPGICAMGGAVFLNGRKIGNLDAGDGKRAFSFRADVTAFLKRGAENEIAVRLDAAVSRSVARNGIVGNVYLRHLPETNIGEPEIQTSLEKRNITVKFHGVRGTPKGSLKLDITDVKDRSKVFSKTVPWSGKVVLPFVTPKLWTPENPNLYRMDFTLSCDGKTVDSLSRTFGFREFKIVGWQYFLNGNPIRVKADTGVCGESGLWAVDWRGNDSFFRAQIRSMKKLNLNATYFDTAANPELYRIADEEGLLLILSRTLPVSYIWRTSREEILGVVEKQLKLDREDPRYFNHPSQIAFLVDVWANFHCGTTNPEYVGLKSGIPSRKAFSPDGKIVTKKGGDPNMNVQDVRSRKEKLDAVAALFRSYFPEFETFTGGSGEVGRIYSTHTYHTWGAPMAEMRAFFSRWALQRERPLFIGETNLPYPGSFYSINEFSAAGANPLFKENSARFEGNRAYEFKGVYGRRALHDHHGDSLQSNTFDRNARARYSFHADLYTSALIRYMSETLPGWRLNDVNGFGMFCYATGQHFLYAGVVPLNWKPDFAGNLSEPRQRSARWQGGAFFNPLDDRVATGDLRYAESAVPFAKVFAPLYCGFYEDSANLLEQNHAYYGNEVLRKKLVLMNDSPENLVLSGSVWLENLDGTRVRTSVLNLSLKPFERRTVQVRFALPFVPDRTPMRLKASFARQDNSVAMENSMDVEIFPSAVPGKTNGGLFVYDPEGRLIPVMKKLGYSFVELKNLESLPESGVLVIGRRGIRFSSHVPDFSKAASGGLGILVMEQESSASAELMVRRSRRAFVNAAGHPVFSGLADGDFQNWRGSFSIVPAYGESGEQKSWSDNGNANMVASIVFRRPSYGNFRSLLVSGFDLFQTPLLEYVGVKNSWLGSQLEITERLGVDPVATRVFQNMISYLDNRGEFTGKTVFCGGGNGRAFLDRMRVVRTEISVPDKKALRDVSVLILSDPDWDKLDQYRRELASFVWNGGKVIYLHTGKTFRSTAFPFALEFSEAESRQALRKSDSPDRIWRCGWDNNDLYWHEKTKVPAFSGVAGQDDSVVPAVLLRRRSGAGEFIFTTLTPDLFGQEPASGKTSRLLSALFSSCGVRIDNPVCAYTRKSGEIDINLDLSTYGWQFALDPKNVGLKEDWHLGRNGSGKWLQGLIADGVEVQVGQSFEKFIRQPYDGWCWYRLNLKLDEETLNSPVLYFFAGAIDDFDEVYVNGVKIGSTGRETSQWWICPRLYRIPRSALKKGRNIIAVRVFDEKMDGGIVTLPLSITNRPVSGARAWSSPWPAGSKRDYDYKSDIIRQY